MESSAKSRESILTGIVCVPTTGLTGIVCVCPTAGLTGIVCVCPTAGLTGIVCVPNAESHR